MAERGFNPAFCATEIGEVGKEFFEELFFVWGELQLRIMNQEGLIVAETKEGVEDFGSFFVPAFDDRHVMACMCGCGGWQPVAGQLFSHFMEEGIGCGGDVLEIGPAEFGEAGGEKGTQDTPWRGGPFNDALVDMAPPWCGMVCFCGELDGDGEHGRLHVRFRIGS